jgi:uncharacterized protein
VSQIRVASLQRYPVKGLSPERLSRVTMTAGGHFPGDRMFAIENGPSGFDPAAPVHMPKIRFLMLMKQEALARLQTCYDDATATLHITHEGKPVLAAPVDSEAGRAEISAFFTRYMPDDLRGAPQWLSAPDGFRFMDSSSGHVSLINLASVAALEQRLDAPLDPLRFRGNLHLEGLAPWAEFDLVGKELAGPSGLRLKVTKRIDRCAATSVDPATGIRDLPVVKTLMSAYGHIDCGVYCEIVSSGTLSEGERLRVIETPEPAGLGLR